MKVAFEIEENPDYLRFDSAGSLDADSHIEYFNAVADECRKRGHKKALVVEVLEWQLSTTEVYQIGKQLPALFRGLKVAVVDTEAQHKLMIKFGETVAVNRGTNALVFQNETDAEQWLMSS